jgi:hypothetical protein
MYYLEINFEKVENKVFIHNKNIIEKLYKKFGLLDVKVICLLLFYRI